jgi:hypothetical protein
VTMALKAGVKVAWLEKPDRRRLRDPEAPLREVVPRWGRKGSLLPRGWSRTVEHSATAPEPPGRLCDRAVQPPRDEAILASIAVSVAAAARTCSTGAELVAGAVFPVLAAKVRPPPSSGACRGAPGGTAPTCRLCAPSLRRAQVDATGGWPVGAKSEYPLRPVAEGVYDLRSLREGHAMRPARKPPLRTWALMARGALHNCPTGRKETMDGPPPGQRGSSVSSARRWGCLPMTTTV